MGQQPIYSHDPETERRLLQIRDTPNDRLRVMAEQRAELGRRVLDLTDVELTWLLEDVEGGTIANLSPFAYHAIIRTLGYNLRTARSRDYRNDG